MDEAEGRVDVVGKLLTIHRLLDQDEPVPLKASQVNVAVTDGRAVGGRHNEFQMVSLLRVGKTMEHVQVWPFGRRFLQFRPLNLLKLVVDVAE